MKIGRIVPFKRQSRGDGHLPLEKELPPGSVMGEIREANDHLPTDAQGLLQHEVEVFHLLKRLVEDDVIEGPISVVG